MPTATSKKSIIKAPWLSNLIAMANNANRIEAKYQPMRVGNIYNCRRPIIYSDISIVHRNVIFKTRYAYENKNYRTSVESIILEISSIELVPSLQ